MNDRTFITTLPNLLAFWDFQEPTGQARQSHTGQFVLHEAGGKVPRVEDGVFGSFSASFGSGAWLELSRERLGALNISGKGAQMTVVAWVKRRHVPALTGACQAVAGIWNEHGKRQYCLFLNLRIHESAEQVGAHISSIGGPTPGEKYCMDAAIGATPVPFDQWCCIAMSYDGKYARSYLNGELDVRGVRNPYFYPQGIYDAGPQSADFTVGAVTRPATVDENRVEHGSVQSNLFQGLLGGLAIFDRALTETEMCDLASVGKR